MSSKRITELTELETSEDDDVIAIVDDSAGETKKQTKGNLLKEVYTKDEVDALITAIDVPEIDLSAQCDGSATAFALGQTVKVIICVKLNGTFVNYTLNGAKDEISLTFAPDSGEELFAICLVY